MAPQNSEIYTIKDEKMIHNDFYEKEYKCEEALDVIGFGKVQILVLLTCGLTLMAVICETMGMMIVAIALQCDLNLVNYQKGLLSAISLLGMLISAYVMGYLTDTFGRKKIIFWSLISTATVSFLSILTNNFWIFLIMRLLCGICISGPSASLFAYLGEFNNLKNRSIAISCASIFVGFANIYIAGIAWILLPQTWAIYLYDGLYFRPWKLVLMTYSLPGLTAAILLCSLPESPKFLLSQHKEREAFKIVEWIYVRNTGKQAESFVVRKLQVEGDKGYIKNLSAKTGCRDIVISMWNQTVPLFRKPHLISILICSITQFGIFCTATGIGLWFPEIQNRVNSMDGSEALSVCSIIDLTKNNISNVETGSQICDDTVNPKVYVDTISLGVLYMIGYGLIAILINSVGRGILLFVILLSSGMCGLSLIWITHQTAIVLLFCSFLVLSGLCIAIVNSAIVDLTPTHLRGMAVCIQSSFGRLGGIVGSNLVGWLLFKNCSITFSLFAGYLIFCALLIPFLPKNAS